MVGGTVGSIWGALGGVSVGAVVCSEIVFA